MAHIQFLDELIKEYFLFRGFTNTLRALDSELKVDKDKGFRVDKIVDQLLHHISSYDLVSLRDLWNHLDQRMFAKLDSDFLTGVKKIENSLLKLYLVNAVSNNKPEKVNDFFTKMTPELQGQAEWKDWFALPYLKNPEDNPTFMVYFSKHWQDTLFLSLHNLLSLIYQAMPLPVLASYEEDAGRLRRLQQENESLRDKLKTLSQCTSALMPPYPASSPPPPLLDIMDDFFIIAQEGPSVNTEGQGRSIRSLMRTIGGSGSSAPATSPNLPRKDHQDDGIGSHRHSSKVQRKVVTSSQPGWMKHSSGESVPKRSLSLDSRRRGRDSSAENIERRGLPKKDTFLLLSQEKMVEHKASVNQCKFSSTGSLVASCDSEGVVKIWSPAPTPKVVSGYQCKKDAGSLTWVGGGERLLTVGTNRGSLHLLDITHSKPVWDIAPTEPCLSCDRMVALCSCPALSVGGPDCFVCLIHSPNHTSDVSLVDVRSGKIQGCFGMGELEGVVAQCCVVVRDALLMAGFTDGYIRTLDLRCWQWADAWKTHTGPVSCLAAVPDLSVCFSLGSDHKVVRHEMSQGAWESSWSDCLSKCRTSHGTQGLALHQAGSHALTLCGPNPPNIYQVGGSGLVQVLCLADKAGTLLACDWASANQCSTCISASSDGKINISTILTP